jgi:topoisomerase-4 subunit A
VRARYEIEEMARGAWQLVFKELPPGVSSAKVLSEIGVLLNPQPKPGKKAIEQSAAQLKALMASQLDRARDESGKDDDVRLVFEPSSSRIDRHEFVALLLAHTSLETSAPINLVAVGIDGRPCQKSLADLIGEWCTFRIRTVHRRTEFRLQKADDRIHILEGRHIVFLNIDEVIRIIRESDDPKAALIARFTLSDRQAEDILEIRLRQLARLEGIRIEQELAKLRGEREGLLKLLGSDALLRRQVIREIKADAEKHGDARRTIIETGGDRFALGSRRRRRRAGDRDHLREGLGAGQAGAWPGSLGRRLQGRRPRRFGAGMPFGRLAGDHLDRGARVHRRRSPVCPTVAAWARRCRRSSTWVAARSRMCSPAAPDDELLIAKTSGYGFICKYGDLLSRQKAGKAFLTVEDGAGILPPLRIAGKDHLAALSEDGRLLIFPLEQMKRLASGKGVQIIGLRGGIAARGDRVQGPRVTIKGNGAQPDQDAGFRRSPSGQRARRGSPVGQISNVTLEAYPE